MTLGQELEAFSAAILDEAEALKATHTNLCQFNIGGTAIRTDINTSDEYQAFTIEYLKSITNLPMTSAKNLIAASWDVSPFVSFLRLCAVLL